MLSRLLLGMFVRNSGQCRGMFVRARLAGKNRRHGERQRHAHEKYEHADTQQEATGKSVHRE